MTDRNLLLPGLLPDGSVEWRENVDINRRLRDGDATLGWDGDPTLTCVLNLTYEEHGRRVGRVEIWQRLSDTEQRLLVWRRGTRVPSDELIRQLVAHDTHHVDVAAMVAAHNAQVDKDRDDQFDGQLAESGDKLAWALGKDLAEPAQSGRTFAPRKGWAD